MNEEDIICMARNEYGIYAFTADTLAEFCSLVAATEREACARLCDNMFHYWCNQEFKNEDEALRNKPDAENCREAIRARGQA
jgi:hypothetical protein